MYKFFTAPKAITAHSSYRVNTPSLTVSLPSPLKVHCGYLNTERNLSSTMIRGDVITIAGPTVVRPFSNIKYSQTDRPISLSGWGPKSPMEHASLLPRDSALIATQRHCEETQRSLELCPHFLLLRSTTGPSGSLYPLAGSPSAAESAL